jgi:hypothetical protein
MILEKIMRKLLILCLSILVISTCLFAQESKDAKDNKKQEDKTVQAAQPAQTTQKEEKVIIPEQIVPYLGVTLSLDYVNAYLWRGLYFFGGDGAFFPYITFDVVQTGLVISTGCELDDKYLFDGGEKASAGGRQSLDYGIDYHYCFGDTATIGAGIWYYFTFNDQTNSLCTVSIWASMDSIPLRPTLKYTHDIYTNQSPDKIGKDLYLELSGSHDFYLSKMLTMDFGLAIGYYYSYIYDTNGISNITFTTNLIMNKGGFTVKGGFQYSIVPMEDYWGSNRDINRFSANVGLGYTF